MTSLILLVMPDSKKIYRTYYKETMVPAHNKLFEFQVLVLFLIRAVLILTQCIYILCTTLPMMPSSFMLSDHLHWMR